MTGYFISGDIGGTKTLLQATELKDGDAQVCCERRYASQEYAVFFGYAEGFLAGDNVAGYRLQPRKRLFCGGGTDHATGSESHQLALGDG